jgi:hypothetical protein
MSDPLSDIKARLDQEDYSGAYDLASQYKNAFTGFDTNVNNPEWIRNFSTCRELIGDSLFGLDNATEALREFEHAINLRAQVSNPVDDSSMLLLFKIERTLGRIYEQEKYQSFDGDRKWKASVLEAAGERMSSSSEELDQKRVLRQTHLNQVWNKSIEEVKVKKEKEKEKEEKEQKKAAKRIERFKEKSKKQFKKIKWGTAGIPILLFLVIFAMLGMSEVALLVMSDVRARRVLESDRKGEPMSAAMLRPGYIIGRGYGYPGSPDVLAFMRGNAKLNGENLDSSVPYCTELTSLLEYYKLLWFTSTNKVVWLDKNAYGLVTKDNDILFDRATPEYTMANKVSKLVEYCKETDKKPDPVYSNPYGEDEKELEFASIEDGEFDSFLKELPRKYKLDPGSIVLIRRKGGDSDSYCAVAAGKDNVMLPIGSHGKRYLSDSDGFPSIAGLSSNYQGIVVAERSTKFIFILTGMVVCAIFLIGAFSRIFHKAVRFVLIIIGLVCASLTFYYYSNNYDKHDGEYMQHWLGGK